jgi:signal peptidase II
MPRVLGWFCLSIVIIVFDYVTKIAVLGSLAPGQSHAVAPFFNLVLVFNKGAAFSFLAGAQGWQTLFFAAIAIVASIVVSFLILKNGNKPVFCAALSLILGGALGNLYDRLVYGQVVDFLDFHAAGWHWPAFNVADSAITIGAAILIVESFFQKQSK